MDSGFLKKPLLFVLPTTFLLCALISCSNSTSTVNTYTVGGTVNGLVGTLVLQNNGENDSTVTANGSFEFSTALQDGTAFSVTVSIDPFRQTCTVTNGTGNIHSANVTNVQVSCVDNVTLSGKIAVPSGVLIDSDVNNVMDVYIPNDTFNSAQILPNPISVGGYVNVALSGANGRSYLTGDLVDYFQVQLKDGDTIALAIGQSDTVTNDLDLYLYDTFGNQLDESRGTGAYEIITAPDDGNYFVYVYAYSGASNYILTIGSNTTAGAGAAAEAGILSMRHAFVPGQVIVRFKKTVQAVPLSQAARVQAASMGMELLSGESNREMLMTFDDLDTQTEVSQAQGINQKLSMQKNIDDPEMARRMNTIEVIKALRKRTDILSAEPNYILHHLNTEPNDTYYDVQWHYPQINLPQAWDYTTGDNNVIVAVVDTGVLTGHPDLSSRLTNTGYDFISSTNMSNDGDGIDPNPDDPGDSTFGNSSFHGTHCAGTIAAETNNAKGMAGVTWDTQVMPIRVMGIGGGTVYDIMQGIRYAAGLSNDSETTPAQTADILSMSLGGGGYLSSFQDLVDDVRDEGIIVIAAAGNENTSILTYPASYEGVISVSAVNINGIKAYYSNYGSEIDLTAPGGEDGDVNGDGYSDRVWSTCGNDSSGSIVYNYAAYNGTSMAAPHVAGVVALMKSLYTTLLPVELDFLISNGAITNDIGAAGRDDFYGNGLIDALKAVVEAQDATGGAGITGFSVDPTTVNFGTNGTSHSVTVSKFGNGELSVAGVSDDADWLTVTETTVDNDGFGIYTIQADRNGLTQDGTYTTTVTFTASSGDSVSVQVTLQVGTVSVTYDAGYHYVLLYRINDDSTIEWAAQYDVKASAGYYSYTFDNVSPGTYVIGAGSDRDNDLAINNPGESTGAYPTVDQRLNIEAISDLSGLDFKTDLRLSIPSSSISTEQDVAQPQFMRLK